MDSLGKSQAVGGHGAVNVFGGEMNIASLSLKPEYHGHYGQVLGSFKDFFRQNYNYRCQTEINLTVKMKEALTHLQNSYAVVIHGNPGEGKTACAFRLAKCLVDKGEIDLDRCVLLSSADDLKHIKTSDIQLILVDDIFGKFNSDPCKLSGWRSHFDTLESLVANRSIRIIVASRMHILLEYEKELANCKVFSNRVLLKSGDLSKTEKQDILNSQLCSFRRKMKESEINDCVSQFILGVGFPLCCHRFASDEKLFCQGAQFFSTACKSYHDYGLQVLENKTFLIFLYVFYNENSLSTNDLNLNKISEKSKTLLSYIAENRGVTEPFPKIIREIKEKIEYFKGSYLKEINENISYLHESLYEKMARLIWLEDPVELIKTCTIDFLCQCIVVQSENENDNIAIKEVDFSALADRCINEVVQKLNGKRLSKHPMMKHQVFVKKLLSRISSSHETLREFFSTGLSSKREGIHGFLYHVLSGVKGNGEFLEQSLHHLTCNHAEVSHESCWKCQVKEEALAAICGTNNLDIYKQLRDDGVSVTGFCLYKVMENAAVDLELVKIIIRDLKESDKFVLDDVDLQMSLGMSIRHENQELFEMLKQNGLRATVHFLYFAVQTGDANLLKSTITDLKQSSRWKADNYYVSRAFVEAFVTGNNEMLEILSSQGAKMSEGAVFWAVEDHGFESVTNIVEILKTNGAFDGESIHLAWSLAIALKKSDRKIFNFLKTEEVVATSTQVLAMAEIGQSAEQIKEVITELKEDGRWNPEDRFIAGAFLISIKRANNSLKDVLIEEGVNMCPACFYYAIIFYPEDIEDVVRKLKSCGRFDPKDKNIARAMVWSKEYRDPSMFEKLLELGLYFNMASLVSAVEPSFSLATLNNVIDGLKSDDRWNPKSDFAVEALNAAYTRQDKTAYRKLLSEGIEWSPRNLYLAVKNGTVFGLKQVMVVLHDKNLLDSSHPDIKKANQLASSYTNKTKYAEIKKDKKQTDGIRIVLELQR